MEQESTKVSTFQKMARFINEHVGEVVNSEDILLGKEPTGNAVELKYLRGLRRLGYIRSVGDSFTNEKGAQFEVVKALPAYYNALRLQEDLREQRGFIPESGGQQRVSR